MRFSFSLAVAVCVLTLGLSLSQAHAAGGLDTGGVDQPLPFNIGGNEVMRLTATSLGIGTTTPKAMLDVTGGIRPGSNGISLGGACGVEGTLGYDRTAHTPVFCTPAGVWASMVTAGTVAGWCVRGHAGSFVSNFRTDQIRTGSNQSVWPAFWSGDCRCVEGWSPIWTGTCDFGACVDGSSERYFFSCIKL